MQLKSDRTMTKMWSRYHSIAVYYEPFHVYCECFILQDLCLNDQKNMLFSRIEKMYIFSRCTHTRYHKSQNISDNITTAIIIIINVARRERNDRYLKFEFTLPLPHKNG